MAGVITAALALGSLQAVQGALAAPGDIDLGLSDGDLTAAAAASGGLFALAGNTITVSGGPVTVTGTTTSRNIVIDGTGPVAVTLNAATLGATGAGAAIAVANGTANLTLQGSSSLTGSAAKPGLGIAVGATANVTAASTGTLAVSGLGETSAIGGDGGAMNPDPQNPSGITGRTAASCGTLTVAGGTVEAAHGPGEGAAIGGGLYGAGCGVTISGGQVTATTAGTGAAIGGAAGEDDIIVTYGWDSPGGDGGTVAITGGTVTATAIASESPAIGGGRGGRGMGPVPSGTDGATGTLTIQGGSVKLTGNEVGPRAIPRGGAAGTTLVAMGTVPNSAGVTGATLGGADLPIAANHPSDNALYVWVPTPGSGTVTHALAVTTGGGTTDWVLTSRSNGTVTVALDGEPVLSLTAPTFAQIQEGDPQPAAAALTIANTGTGPAQITGVTSSSTDFVIGGTTTLTVAAGDSNNTSVTVQPAAGLGIGTHTATISVAYTSASGDPATASVSLVVAAAATPETRLLTMTAPSFASVAEGAAQPAAQGVTLTSTGTGAVAVSSVTSSDTSRFTVSGSGVTIPAGDSNSTAFTVRPVAGLAAGTHTATLTATYNGTSGTTATATVSLVVTAVGPGETRVLTVTAPSFASVQEGAAQPAAQGITLASTGSGAVSVTGVTSSDTSKFTVSGSGVTVPGGGSNSSAFTVRPVAGLGVGTHTATLTATYNGTSGTTATAVVSLVVTARPTQSASPTPSGGGTTSAPPTSAPPTSAPPTSAPPTSAPPTSAPTTAVPTTAPTPKGKVAAKVTAKLVKAKIARAKAGQIKITVKASGVSKPTGKIKVTVRKGAKTVKTKTYTLAAKAKGKATLKLPKLPAGSYSITVAYQGSAQVKAKTVKIAKKLQIR
jgi:hypothetical protein